MRRLILERGECAICSRRMDDPVEWRRGADWRYDEETGEYTQTVTEIPAYWTVDHIKPIILGGKQFDIRNLQLLCPVCSWRKNRFDLRLIARLRYTFSLPEDRDDSDYGPEWE